MKKALLILIGCLTVTLLFFACEKGEGLKEEITLESNDWLSSERAVDCTPCLDEDGCCCRLINLNSTGKAIDLCPENYISPPPGPGLNLFDWRRIPFPGNTTFMCNIPRNDCDPTFTGVDVVGWYLHTTAGWTPGSDAANHYYFPHNTTISFCHAPAGYIRVCNPESSPAEWHLVCGLDVYPPQWETFWLLPGQCRLFKVDSNCDVNECDEVI